MSRLIKSAYSHSQNTDKKIIQLQPLTFEKMEDESPEQAARRLHIQAEQALEQAKEKAIQLERESERRLQEASMQIEQMRLNFEREKEEMANQVRQVGYQEGLELGKQEMYNELTSLIDEANTVVDLAKSDYAKVIEQSEETILKLGIKVAEKILHTHLKENQEDFLYIVKDAINEVKDHSDVSIKVHPTMYELVSSQKEEITSLFNGDKNLYIYSSQELEETSCIIESSFGRIDASVDSQLTEIKTKLLDLLEEE